MAEVTPPLFQTIDGVYTTGDIGLPYRDIVAEGVVGNGLAVTERGAGANMSVDVAAGVAWVRGDDSDLQPTYRCYNDATVNLAVTAADGSNPRIDRVIAEVRDAEFAGVSTDWRLRVIPGTPAGSPVAPAEPNNAITLATISVPALDTTIGAAQITDTRPRAATGGPSGAMTPAGPVLLANTTLTATTATIDFSSISQAYGHLWLVAYLRGTAALTITDVRLRFNNDSGANYDVQFLNAVAAAVAASETFGTTSGQVGTCPGSTAGANLFSPLEARIPHYAQALSNKAFTSAWGWKAGTGSANMQVGNTASFWRSNAAINRVTILPASGSFAAGSRVSLYGMP